MSGPGTASGTCSNVVSARGRAVAVLLACLAVGACTSGSGPLDFNASVSDTDATAKDTRSDLAKATDATGKDFVKEPRNAEKALAYARSLKAMGEKRQALAVLQQASNFNAGHRALNSEYGRLALELEQVSLAQRLLEAADDPANPDWRIISARGTVLAKLGSYRDAIPLYERALALAPNQPSILNNLALAHAMEGHADQAERLLKRAGTAADGKNARVNQNLALVLSLQGKYEEARLIAARDLPADNAADNVDFVRRIVKLEPRPMSQPQAPPPSLAKGPAPPPVLKGTARDDGAAGWTAQVAVAPAKQ